jgi:hypothetical protein
MWTFLARLLGVSPAFAWEPAVSTDVVLTDAALVQSWT